MNIAQIRKFDIANGTGIRTSVFVAGCTHNCPGCFNQDYMNFSYGTLWDDAQTKQIIAYLQLPMVEGLTLLGGEPMQQDPEALYRELSKIREAVPKTIWMYSGYTFEELIRDEKKKHVLSLIDVLVDGLFEEEKKSAKLKFRGSANQRILDVPESLKKGEAVEVSL